MTVPYSRLSGADVTNTLLHDIKASLGESITTIHSGKWHINPTSPSKTYTDYNAVVAQVKDAGFDAVVGLYESNMEEKYNLDFSHNPEWMASILLETQPSLPCNHMVWYGMVRYGMVDVCEGAPVAVSGWVLTDRHDLVPCAANNTCAHTRAYPVCV